MFPIVHKVLIIHELENSESAQTTQQRDIFPFNLHNINGPHQLRNVIKSVDTNFEPKMSNKNLVIFLLLYLETDIINNKHMWAVLNVHK